MERCLKSLAVAAFALAAASGCSPTTAAGDAGNCNATCPQGCSLSADCSACIPASASAGAGSACTTSDDCCTGTCVNSVCTPPSSNGGSTGGGTGASATGGTGGGSTGGGNAAVGSACTVSGDCSSDYCKASVCTCNGADPSDPYKCQVATDCCAGTTCVASTGATQKYCVAATSGGSTGGGGACASWTGTAPPTGYDSACNGNDGGIDNVCSPTGTCVPNCTITAAYCTAGETCDANGHCSAAAGSTGGSTGAVTTAGATSGGGTSAGGTGGATGGGSTGGSTGLATACTLTVDTAELSPCDGGVNGCPTGLTCANDPNFGPTCEYACTTIASCPDLITNCTAGSCVINLCGVAGANGTNGTYDGTCAAASTADGTCEPDDADGDGGTALFGLCLQGGSIANDTATCEAAAACAANDLCAAGWVCNTAAQTDPTGSCLQLCDPTTKTGCATGSTCQAQSTDVGACIPNTSGGSTGGGSTGGGTTGGGTGGATTSGGSSGGSTGSLPGDTCSSCDSIACTGASDDCVFDPNDPSETNGYCAGDCSNAGGTGPDNTLCAAGSGTSCLEVFDATGSGGDDGQGDDWVCYPTAGTCIGGGSCGASGTKTGVGGASCGQATDCCSGFCDPTNSTCACNLAGGTIACTHKSQCNPGGATESAGGVCTGGFCSFPCTSDTDCCTTSCVAGFCQ